MQLAMYDAIIAKTPTKTDDVPLKERTFDDFAIMSLISFSVFNASLFSMCFLQLKVLCTAKLIFFSQMQNNFWKKIKQRDISLIFFPTAYIILEILEIDSVMHGHTIDVINVCRELVKQRPYSFYI